MDVLDLFSSERCVWMPPLSMLYAPFDVLLSDMLLSCVFFCLMCFCFSPILPPFAPDVCLYSLCWDDLFLLHSPSCLFYILDPLPQW